MTRKTIALMLCLTLLGVCLAGCGIFPGAAEPTASPVPMVTYQKQGNYTIPQLSGADASVNAQLAVIFQKALEPLQGLQGATVEYRVDETAGYLALSVQVLVNEKVALRLPAVFYTPEHTLRIPEQPLEEAIAKAAQYIGDLQWAQGFGLSLSDLRYDERANLYGTLRMMVEVYEHLSGKSVHADRIDPAVTDPMIRKALELSLYYYSSYQPTPDNSDISPGIWSDLVQKWADAMNENLLAQTGRAANGQDALEYMDLFGALFTPAGEEEPQKASEFLGNEVSAQDELNRYMLAQMLVEYYEARKGVIEVRPDATQDVTDLTPSQEYACKAISAGLMYAYPSARTFTGDLTVRMGDLPSLIYLLYDRTLVFTDERETSGAAYQPMTWQAVLHAVRQMGEFYAQKKPCTQEPVTVQNGRDYNWFYSQTNTGEYSSVNCMPTATSMVLKWYDESFSDTPEDLRNLYPNLVEGWTINPVYKTLKKYKVPFTLSYSIDRDAIMAELDKGNIVFAQMNTHDVLESGHCFVIYGYEKRRDSVWFIVNDPGSDMLGKYGIPEDQGQRLESNYVCWIIDRFTSMYLSIPQPGSVSP